MSQPEESVCRICKVVLFDYFLEDNLVCSSCSGLKFPCRDCPCKEFKCLLDLKGDLAVCKCQHMNRRHSVEVALTFRSK